MPNLPQWEISPIGIDVTDMDRMRDFYTSLPGFKVMDAGAVRSGMRLTFSLSDREIEVATHNGIAGDPSTRPFAKWRADKQREFDRTN